MFSNLFSEHIKEVLIIIKKQSIVKLLLIFFILTILTGFAIFETYSANFKTEEVILHNENINAENVIEMEIETPNTNEAEKEEIIIDYNTDILFIGNSLVEGLKLTSSSSNNFIAKAGISLDELNEKVANKTSTYNSKIVIIGMGTNELGYYTKEQFKSSYNELITQITLKNKDIKIVCLSIPPTTKRKSETNKNFNNENVKIYNEYIREICGENNATYLDNEGYFGTELSSDWSDDGIHLKGYVYKNWYDWIIENVSKQPKGEANGQ